jgi:hypothetical protein
MSARRRVGALVMLSLSACADFDAPAPVSLPDLVVADPSFAADIQPIFTLRCATASCHTAATHQLGLNLAAGAAYDATVGRASQQRPTLLLVNPGRPDLSRLVQVLLSDAAPRMPLGRDPLTANQITTMQNWITKGAKRN